MAIFKGRFSSDDLLHLFVFCAFPIHIWTFANMFRDVPSWALYMRYWELISTVAYTLAFALFETLIILLPLIVLGMLIPRRWVSSRFIPWAGVMLVEGTIAAIAFQIAIMNHSPKKYLVIGIGLMFGISSILVIRHPKIGEILRSIAKRLVVLSFLYIFLDVVGLVIVIARNV